MRGRSRLPQTNARVDLHDRLDAGAALLFMSVVFVLLVTSAREWWLVLSRRKPARTREAPFVRSAHAAGD